MINIDNLKSELLACPLCESINISSIGPIKYTNPLKFSTLEIQLKQAPVLNCCNNCKSWFTNFPVPENNAMELYTEGDGTKRWSHMDFISDKDSKVVDFFNKILSPSMSILDVGSNTGEFLDYAHQKGCHTFGLELSTSSLIKANEKGHTCVDDIDKLKDHKFDIITAFDLVEHLYQPKQFINQLLSYLKPGGKLIILTGNKNSISARILKNNWWYCSYPEHVVFPDDYFFKEVLQLEMIDQIYCSASRIRAEKWFLRLKNALTQWNDLGFGNDHSLFVLSAPSKKE